MTEDTNLTIITTPADARGTPEGAQLTTGPAGSLSTNPAAVYLASLSASSRRPMRQALNRIAEILTSGRVVDCLALDWSQVRYQHAAAVQAALKDQLAPATVNHMITALRGVLRQAWVLGKMSADDYRMACEVKPVRGDRLPAGRELDPGELRALLDACARESGPAGVRDAAIISLMYAAGLRREEVVGLDLNHFEQLTGRLVVMRGKGNKQRATFVSNGAADALSDWIQLRGLDPGPLFWPINKGGKLYARRMTAQAIYNLLARCATDAKVKDFSPHDLRRTFVSDLLEAGADIAVVARMAGHASVNTTARYDRRPEQAKQKAAGLLHVPYTRRG